MEQKIFTIKFSHTYPKIPTEVDGETPIRRAKLLAVFLVDKSELGNDFIEYDTQYLTTTPEEGQCWGHYPLSNGKLLVLLLDGIFDSLHKEDYEHELFTTVRTKYGVKGVDKELYYREHIGEIADIVIEQ